MGLDIYFREDIEQTLYSIQETNVAACDLAEDGLAVHMYMAGFESAIQAVATAFGIVLQMPKQRWSVIGHNKEESRLYLPEFCVIEGEER